jgi:hypothetical protein
MTQPSRTTDSISRDNAAIRELMLRARELTVPDRATLTLGLVGHLATLMNRSQMSKLLAELQEEAERVQDVPPARQQEMTARTGGAGNRDEPRDAERGRSAHHDAGAQSVGQAGRGAFRSGELL